MRSPAARIHVFAQSNSWSCTEGPVKATDQWGEGEGEGSAPEGSRDIRRGSRPLSHGRV